MYNIYLLHSQLKQSEHETAQMLYNQLIADGYTPQKAVSMVYQAGMIDGRHYAKERVARNEYYTKKLAADAADHSEGSAENV